MSHPAQSSLSMNNIIHLKVIIHWVASLLMISLSKSYHLSSISRATYRNARLGLRLQSTLSDANVMYETHKDFFKNVAKVDPPKRLNTLLELLTITGAELVNPRSRAELNPFLIPVSKNSSDNSLLCYIRWPTQKDDMDLQLVTTTECGIILSALNTDHYCHRLAVELDFRGNTKAETALELLNRDGQLYSTGDYFSILKSGKFPATTEEDLRLILDRYLLLKVGSFPDCFERLASNFLKNGNDVSALVTCERAVSLFYSWGHPIHFHTKMLNKLGRDKEAKDSARASMGMPKFTIGSTRSVRMIRI